MKLIHSADWQLGARFTQFGAKSEALRQARLDTLKAALRIATDRRVDAFIIAGDLFEDNQIDDSLVAAVLQLFKKFGSVPIFVLPGNHDPYTGPDSIWSRQLLADSPPNATLLLEAKAIPHAGGYLISSPLTQKVSTIDPSLRLAELARDLPADAVKIGITHGALAIPGKHQPNDFPIDLAAASRAGLDYLAVGHWHNWQAYDGGRLLMPGTPEPDNFDQPDSGCVAFVEVKSRGAVPTVEKCPVATLQWTTIEFDFLDVENEKLNLRERIGLLRERADQIVLRATLRGSASPAVAESAKLWLKSELAAFLVAQIVDQSSLTLSSAEVEQLKQDHPLLVHVLADLIQLEHLLTGSPPPVGYGSSSTITLTEAQRLATNGRIDIGGLKTVHFNLARQVLFQKLREVET